MAKKPAKEEVAQTLDGVLAQIRKQFGEGAIMRFGESEVDASIPVISTGAFSLDVALGVGGLPKGRIVEIYGPESSGKTTLTLHVIANAQKNGGMAAFVDAEHAMDRSRNLLSTRLMKNWLVALSTTDVRAMASVPRSLPTSDLASFLIGA